MNGSSPWANPPPGDAANGKLTATAELPFGCRVTFSFDVAKPWLSVEWDPEPPTIRSPRARRRFLRAYTVARDEFLKDVAATLHGNVGVFHWDGSELSAPTLITAPILH